MARRHVCEGEGHILRQRDLIQHLKDTESPLTEEARALLADFQLMLDNHKRHIAQIEEEIQLGRRDAGGDLLPLRH